MKKKIKEVIVNVLLGIAAIGIGAGIGAAVKQENKFVKISIEDFHNDYINMNDIVDFEATETGLMIYTSSGDSYYWER